LEVATISISKTTDFNNFHQDSQLEGSANKGKLVDLGRRLELLINQELEDSLTTTAVFSPAEVFYLADLNFLQGQWLLTLSLSVLLELQILRE
jgi:hypothetical protein